MQCLKKCLKAIQVCAILLFATDLTHAAGFDLPDVDAFAIGRGLAFVATADNPSAIYYNPAGIAQLDGNNLRGGFYGIYLDPSYQPPAGAANAGNTYHSSENYAALPQFFYTYGRSDFPITVGLGLYSPFGLSTHWPDNTGFRTVVTRGSLSTIAINPSAALKLFPNLSIGGGIVVNYASVDLQQGLSSNPAGGDLFRFNGDGWDVGYNLGVLWRPIDQISLGATFHSAMTVHLRGHTESEMNGLQPPMNSSANADFPLPLKAAFGISYRPTPKWNLEFNADYTDWDPLNTVTIHQTTPSFLVSSPNVPVVLNWQASWYYEFGVTRYFDNGWHVSAGYIFNQNSVPEAYFTPLATDMNRHFFSVGTGFKGKQFDFDVAYQFGYGTRTVSNATGSFAAADGNYKFISHAIAVSLGWHF